MNDLAATIIVGTVTGIIFSLVVWLILHYAYSRYAQQLVEEHQQELNDLLPALEELQRLKTSSTVWITHTPLEGEPTTHSAHSTASVLLYLANRTGQFDLRATTLYGEHVYLTLTR